MESPDQAGLFAPVFRRRAAEERHDLVAAFHRLGADAYSGMRRNDPLDTRTFARDFEYSETGPGSGVVRHPWLLYYVCGR